MKVRRILPIIYGVITAGVIGVAVLSFLLKIATDRMDAYQEQRHASILLSDQLRQSSDDLTRLARTYVVTGDARFEKMYWDVLAIRNGRKPRPANYERIYWDLVLNDNGKPRPDTGKVVPLRELMERAGFTEAEFAKLAEAQKNSDGLVRTEEIAMNMVKGRYKDGSGGFTVKGTPDFETARALMHDAAYHLTKASIMKPIEEFQEMLDERTKQVTSQSFKRTKTLFWALQSILLVLIFSTALLFILKNRQQELELELSRSLQAEVEERKRAEEALRLSEEMFRVLSDQSPLGKALIDGQGRYEYVNPAFEAMLGYTLRDLPTGAEWFRVAFPDPVKRTEAVGVWKEDLARAGVGESRPRIFDVVGKSGASKSILFRPVALQGSRQLVIYEDITERRRIESQLQEAMKMEAVGRLAGGVAHDFNNILTVITGYCELLLQKVGKGGPMHGELGEIKRAGDRAAALTQQLLAFSRKQIIEPKVVRLDLLVAEMQAMMTRLIGENIDLHATAGKGLGSVKIDPGQFQQILMNLAVNARDAMPEGGKIAIETANVDLDAGYCARRPYVTPGRFVMLSVSDTGKGMSEEVKAHIFEPFFTTKERGSGTGLGLATTYGAVKQSGGSIEVYSEVGIGTTFKIYLPRIGEKAAKPANDILPADLPGGTETVLLVEDEDTVRNLGVRILGDLGYRMMRAPNGDEALALAMGYGERIDLLLTDVVMPGMSGSELAARLVPHHPETKVLFTSGYTDDAIVRHGVLDEGVFFIGKPYTPSALARKVRETLDTA